MACKSSFSGNIDEIPTISVDNFDNIDRSAYFLSHYHSDHICGLYNKDLYNNLVERDSFIYTSNVTAAIISNTDNKLTKYVRSLRLGKNTITIKNGENEDIINVTLLPAGHCFGSVMFLFNIGSKTVLYTGDFRVSRNSVEKYTHFHTKSGDPITIDTLYIDTTFQNVKTFPSREETVDCAVLEVKNWLDVNENHCVALHTSANYGYEFLFNEIYKKVGKKVYVNESKWAVYREFEDMLPGVTTDYKTTNIHVCRNYSEKMDHAHCIPNSNNKNYLYMHFSAMKWSNYEENEIFLKKSKNRIDVCFATHCCRSELLHFINYLSPKRIVGFPNDFLKSPEKNDEVVYALVPKRKCLFNIDRRKGCKVDKKLLNDMFS